MPRRERWIAFLVVAAAVLLFAGSASASLGDRLDEFKDCLAVRFVPDQPLSSSQREMLTSSSNNRSVKKPTAAPTQHPSVRDPQSHHHHLRNKTNPN